MTACRTEGTSTWSEPGDGMPGDGSSGSSAALAAVFHRTGTVTAEGITSLGPPSKRELRDEATIPRASWSHRDRHRARGRDRSDGALDVGQLVGDGGQRLPDG